MEPKEGTRATMRSSLLLQFFWLAGACVSISPNLAVAQPAQDLQSTTNSQWKYPATARTDQIDRYHNETVSDPYRWLEDTDSEATKAWVQAQNKVTFDYLNTIPERKVIADRLLKVWNYERYGFPIKSGTKWLFSHNDGLQNQSVLYQAESLDGQRRVLIDPNRLSPDGTVALTDYKPSSNGRYLAYGLAKSGSDWNTWKIRDIESNKDLDDTIEWVKFSSVSWTKDSQGFFYSRYDKPTSADEFTGVNYYQKLYYHKVGTNQSEDLLVFETPDEKEWGFDGQVSDDGKYLVISVWKGTARKNQIYVAPILPGNVPSTNDVAPHLEGFDAEYVYLGNDNETFYFETDANSPKRRIVSIPLRESSDRSKWKTLVAEQVESIEQSKLLGDVLHVCYLQDATSIVRRFKIDGTPLPDLAVPALGTVTGFSTDRFDEETFYSFTNYITPPTLFRLDLQKGESKIWRAPKVAFNSEDFVTERHFYESKDGTRIPIILSFKKGLIKDGQARAFLYGYGGFNISVTPNFSPSNLVWMEQGGVYAVANLRGGGEYGRVWHESGMLEKKQNVFDDFIAAAEFLVSEKITTPSRLTIHGRSNGGLLVGAVMTQRPEIAAVALPAVGVLDMLRFQKFTIGWAWVNEFGSSDSADQFQFLRRYSPLHNLKSGTKYPATLITTGDHDDRVVPGHSFKFAAELQHSNASDAPVMIRIETSAGHGAGTPISKLVDTAADVWAFVIDNTRAAPELAEAE